MIDEFIIYKSIIFIISILVLLCLIAFHKKKQLNKVNKRKQYKFFSFIDPKHKAGVLGEKQARDIIESVLKKKDKLINNISIEYDGKKTELDNVIVNNRGVFIIEVKNYSGIIFGNEFDSEWEKFTETKQGNVYKKIIRNPIKQVNRQVYILAKYLKYYGINVWIEGYIYFVNNNSPIQSKNILESKADINNAIHQQTNNNLNDSDVRKIRILLS